MEPGFKNLCIYTIDFVVSKKRQSDSFCSINIACLTTCDLEQSINVVTVVKVITVVFLLVRTSSLICCIFSKVLQAKTFTAAQMMFKVTQAMVQFDRSHDFLFVFHSSSGLSLVPQHFHWFMHFD